MKDKEKEIAILMLVDFFCDVCNKAGLDPIEGEKLIHDATVRFKAHSWAVRNDLDK